VGISVSRVGGNAQIKAMREVSGSLRLDLASYRELEAFAQLGTELDAASQAQLNRGGAMVELLKQGQYQPFHGIDQAVSIFAGTKGYLDDLPLDKVSEFEQALIDHVHTSHRPLWEKLDQAKSFKGMEDDFATVVGDFAKTWKAANVTAAT
jgi:F-type H+-transporting ATPase subunit alpha